MNRSRRRRHHLAWCRYLTRTPMPYGRWMHRAPGCDNPRPSGLARAWDRVSLHARSWPWKPRFEEAPGTRHGWSAVMVHDRRMREEIRHSRRSRAMPLTERF